MRLISDFHTRCGAIVACKTGRGAMYRATMKRCCMALTLLAFFCKCSRGFVAVCQSQPRAKLAEGGSRRDMILEAAQVGAAPSSLPSPSRRRRRGRGGKQRNQSAGGGGVGSLRAGMDMPSLELVAGFLDGPASLLEQSSRHHYPSAFIGGTVGVVGTLTAIQVCVCCACVCVCVHMCVRGWMYSSVCVCMH